MPQHNGKIPFVKEFFDDTQFTIGRCWVGEDSAKIDITITKKHAREIEVDGKKVQVRKNDEITEEETELPGNSKEAIELYLQIVSCMRLHLSFGKPLNMEHDNDYQQFEDTFCLLELIALSSFFIWRVEHLFENHLEGGQSCSCRPLKCSHA
ncbi:hypothetical protein SUGI_0512700 [Cryptomeria japonica]|nr:hypothetical protein SUGI_0512700 [Cryptomeria japonica]